MRVTSIVVLAACGALLAAAPGASAATLSADQDCYVEGFTMGLSGAGFAPAASISLAGEQIALTGPAGADGTFQAPVKAPLLGTSKPATKTYTVTATDPATSTSATVDVHRVQEPAREPHLEVQRALPAARQADLRPLPP